ncbi:hypothetical protein SAMN04487957_110109 [Halomonas shengliensis]|uniref:Uncharacterized protein n=1 Tax=Halomonas shengliensis TaxID=419597 RepID=A0A1H0LU98_9GAMM|nr:hypothetical protein [Halomonas shengliensis]SDO71715.1 hypothetical protein SAMN04487957_110109 [Halomonas shengliensis]
MSIITKLYDRLTGVLGRDCQGRPLRRGDRVEPAVPPHKCDELAQGPGEVIGIKPGSANVKGLRPRLMVRNANGVAHGAPECWRRLDDDEKASWRLVAKATGWQPRTVPQRDEVEA